MFNIYIKRAAESFGVVSTREIYEKAIEVLPDQNARFDSTLNYTQLEGKIVQIIKGPFTCKHTCIITHTSSYVASWAIVKWCMLQLVMVHVLCYSCMHIIERYA